MPERGDIAGGGAPPERRLNQRCYLVRSAGTPMYESCQFCVQSLGQCLQFRGQWMSGIVLTLILLACLLDLSHWLRVSTGLSAAAGIIIYQRYVARESHNLIETQHRLRVQTRSLDRLVALRTEKLERTNAELQSSLERLSATREQLLVASRRAGMAEVATDILHNVGNVLNSVNVSSELLLRQLDGDSLSGLRRAVGLLRERRGDIDHFLTEDRAGKHLLPYVEQVLDDAEAERSAGREEARLMNERIQHIKAIISRQQELATWSTSVPEPCQVAQLLDDAAALVSASYERHGIALYRGGCESLEIAVDRHQVIQILTNLLSNAKDALAGIAGRPVVRISTSEAAGRVRITVEDNGVGIREEDLDRIFAHGFTTRTEGHGFGLHSAANQAASMGGQLRCESEGPGRGARFVLELPVGTATEEARRLAG